MSKSVSGCPWYHQRVDHLCWLVVKLFDDFDEQFKDIMKQKNWRYKLLLLSAIFVELFRAGKVEDPHCVTGVIK